MSDHARDLKAIQALHRRDMQAAKSGDFPALRALIDDEAVNPAARWLTRGVR